MLNVDRVYSKKWAPLDTLRDRVVEKLDDVFSRDDCTLSDEQKSYVRTAMYNALNTSTTSGYTATAPFLDFQENNGIIIPDTSSCMDIATSMYQEALGDDIDTTSETHVGRMIEQSAIILRSCLGMTAENIMQMDPNAATGRYLDALGAMFFASRKSQEPTSILFLVTNTGESPVTLTGGSAKMVDADNNEFVLQNDVVVPKSGQITISLVCTETGNVVPTEDFTFSNIISESITEPVLQNVTLGYDVESDDDFRERLKTVRVSSIGFSESVESAVKSIAGVYGMMVAENTTPVAQVIDGVKNVGAHSIAVYVDFDGTEDTKQAIAEAIYKYKAIGCGYSDPDVLDDYFDQRYRVAVKEPVFGMSYTVTFYSPKIRVVDVQVSVSSHQYTGTDLEADVKAAIVDWANGDVPNVDGLSIGYSVKSYEIGAAISDKLPEIQIEDVGVRFHDASSYSSRLTIGSYEMATIDESNIVVNVDAI